jgi:hypothetical protein
VLGSNVDVQVDRGATVQFRLKGIVFRVVVVLLGIVVGLYAFELAFRQLFLVHAVPRTERELERLVAGSWPHAVLPEKPEGTIRILGLADSFGLAGGAANYHSLLEESLAAKGLRVEVVNLSVVAYSLDQELRMLQHWGARYEPDVILHGFFVGNDFAPPGPPKMTYRGISVDRVPGTRSWSPQNLMSMQWLAQWRHVLADRRLRETERQKNPDGSFSRANFLRIERTRLSTCRRPRTRGEPWPHTTLLLDQIGQEARRIDAAHVIVVHPDQFQVEPALAEEIVRAYQLNPADYDLDLPLKYLHAYASSRGTPLIDLTPAFRSQGRDGGLYLPLDTHYNAAGNRIATEVIGDALDSILAPLRPAPEVGADDSAFGGAAGSARQPAES